ncbi:Mitochondrial distribution and morphology protein 35 [Lachnellula arida]|uniref:Mitochondrial distribution and morphology protein 35 n=1 Tax=Lachnellula arida TaxID=1316785 RepID=A0A8T9B9Q1_9HELO|nr:Mitochondrial distribution and morphology protein 35 [Lachnellula arida]
MSASLAPECNEVKERYDSCFLKWYSETDLPAEYLRGKGKTDECSALFKDYKHCLTSALKERGIDKMLEDAREDHKENDAANMRRGCEYMAMF